MQPNSLLEVRKSRSSSAGEATPAALASALLRARDVAEIAAIGVLHAELRFGTFESLAPQGCEPFLQQLLARTADLSDRVGRDFLGHVA